MNSGWKQDLSMLRSICVYCGSRKGKSDVHEKAMRLLAGEMVARNISLVYGGGKVGLMGVLADEVLRLGGEVTGVIPRHLLDREVGHDGLTRLFVVKDMHERKALMADKADAFIAASGGMGTLDELLEVFTWRMLGLHAKPIGILNIDGLYDGLLGLFDHLSREDFVDASHSGVLYTGKDPGMLIDQLRNAVSFGKGL